MNAARSYFGSVKSLANDKKKKKSLAANLQKGVADEYVRLYASVLGLGVTSSILQSTRLWSSIKGVIVPRLETRTHVNMIEYVLYFSTSECATCSSVKIFKTHFSSFPPHFDAKR